MMENDIEDNDSWRDDEDIEVLAWQDFIRTELKKLSRNEEAHIEQEWEEYDQLFPQD